MSSSAAAERTARATDRRWEEACDEHRVALAAYLDTAEGLSDEAWTRPWAPGKWTPAEITEHLTMTYEVVIGEMETGRGMAMKTSGWRLRLLRWVLLPHILFHRSLPLKARAPREVRPASVRAPRHEALRQLQALGETFEQRFDRA
ncbi:MAG TPA: DinB family protein, partial [Longimicrobium sp.]|nr:DinB family protein [Longimicrobium sp.]